MKEVKVWERKLFEQLYIITATDHATQKNETQTQRKKERVRQRDRERDRKKESLCTYNDFFVCERECVCVHKLRLSQGKQVTFLNWTTFCLLSLSLGLAMAVIRQT